MDFFLSIDEISHLQRIVRKHPKIKSVPTRTAVLEVCDLMEDLSTISVDGDPDEFLTLLLAELKDKTFEKQGKHAMVILLAYLYPENVSLHVCRITKGEKQFLHEVMRRCKEWHIPDSSPQQWEDKINTMLAQEQMASSFSTRSTSMTRFDKRVLINYDLDSLVGSFAGEISPGQVSAFTLAGEYDMLKDYILERMCQRFAEIIRPRHYQLLDINLNTHDLKRGRAIKEIVLQKHGCQSGNMVELLSKYPDRDIVLVIWNYVPVSRPLKVALSSFWSGIDQNLLAMLKAKGLYFTIVLAHLGQNERSTSIEYFTSLHLQKEKFKKSTLEPWLNSTLQRLCVEPDDMLYCLNMLYQDATPIEHYRQLEHMVEYLQGRSVV